MTVLIPPTTSKDSDCAHGETSHMSTELHATRTIREDGSDYGDFTLDEQEIIDELLANIPSATAIEDELLELTDIEDYEEPSGVRLPKTLGKELCVPPWLQQQQPKAQITFEDTPSNDLCATNVDSAAEDKRALRERERQQSLSVEPPQPDTRSPLERFRTKPKKALSVTDLVSPAWCELQYFYTLSKHGKKRATPAMRQGTKVHKKLEDEVHTTVPVSITTKEDSWGLRIWNVIQGLRTLRETGMTRELEVWGVVDGEVVNGVIDELSYKCPNPEFEEREARRLASGKKAKGELSDDQPTITDYLRSPAGGNGKTFVELGKGIEASLETPPMPPPATKKPKQRKDDRKIYIIDIKTRSMKSLPTAMAARPTEVQLQLYHSMLTALAQGTFPLSTFANRYNFDPSVQFSDSFIAQVGSLNEQFFDAISSPSQGDGNEDSGANNGIPASSQDSIDILLKHNTINSLWSLMISQFQETFLLRPLTLPQSSSPPSAQTNTEELETRLSPLLTATYVHPSSSEHLGNKHFIHSPADLTTYIADEMAWWRGERSARGVDIAEVNAKCSRCEFLGECEWVKEREREVWDKVGRGRSRV